MKKKVAPYAAGLALAALFPGCVGDNERPAFDPNENYVEAHELEQSDFRLTVTKMVLSLHSSGAFKEFSDANAGKKPLLAVGAVANESGTVFDAESLSKSIATIIAAGGRARVAGLETTDAGSASSFEDAIPNFTLTGKITGTGDNPELSLALTDINTGGVAWAETKKIKK